MNRTRVLKINLSAESPRTAIIILFVSTQTIRWILYLINVFLVPRVQSSQPSALILPINSLKCLH